MLLIFGSKKALNSNRIMHEFLENLLNILPEMELPVLPAFPPTELPVGGGPGGGRYWLWWCC